MQHWSAIRETHATTEVNLKRYVKEVIFKMLPAVLFLLHELLGKAGLLGHKADEWLMGTVDGEVDYRTQGTSGNAKTPPHFLIVAVVLKLFSVCSECSDLYIQMDILHCI